MKPTCEDIFDEELGDPVYVERSPWRHGNVLTEVYRRESDDTFWQVQYRVSTDGETNELREGFASIEQVYPHQVTATVYKSSPA